MLKTGLEILLERDKSLLQGRKIGLVSHPAAVLRDLTSCRDALLAAGLKITALFAPEHGFCAHVADGTVVDHETDPGTGLPVYSLYGESREPSAEMLAGVDLMIFDLQDVGVRFYTFLSTLFHVMRGCGRVGKPLLVLDRPNPIGGVRVEGPLVEPGFESFLGVISIPIRHGMTFGELALYINDAYHLGVNLRVISMQGWQRGMWFDQTGLAWVPTSPAMTKFETTIPYPGTCFVEGTNLSEGRGTGLPFEVTGAPWLDGPRLARTLNALHLPGVLFRPHVFEPCAGKHMGTVCQGVQLHVIDRQRFLPCETGLHLLAACRAQAPAAFDFLDSSWEGRIPHLDLLAGSAKIRTGLETGIPVQELCRSWEDQSEAFRKEARVFNLYS
jgi:uncharacterized protein YbbC (DUF1343 family)